MKLKLKTGIEYMSFAFTRDFFNISLLSLNKENLIVRQMADKLVKNSYNYILS